MGPVTPFIYLPLKPSTVIQPFGANPEYYARFLDANGNPEKGHMGIDFVAAHATPLYATCDGQALYVVDAHGGDGIYILTTINGQKFFVIHWHLCSKDDPKYAPIIPADNKYHDVKAGDLIGYTDNTGAPFESSGDHLHLGLVPLLVNGNFMFPANGYGGCIDPAPYFLTTYAVDVPQKVALLRLLIKTLQALLDALKK